ncbi:hypothetical protein [Methylobacterium oxalidis]|uniref:Uncharacterized protein n=1 Tax=Methylobacterium oxalidis TaxID=944322 RepID=A0A512J7B8_9HYPH|nr:hypothetical protein [Methylobacterium oxalidis]GEP05864.1 hypothetical protein MOX02_39020 [Methylobacterium oxalidis]GJE34118.1 hypothetical protein LDDCCGHA_4322 [Methylobacterium oxalidis]GLS61631.1 hypothetical protein GCM10007888_00120 [Methylobacterium oxalidis]
MPSISTLLSTACMSALVIGGLTLLVDTSTRAQLDRALRSARLESPTSPHRAAPPPRQAVAGPLDRQRLQATVLMVSQPGDE